jgi:hypothetical protein
MVYINSRNPCLLYTSIDAIIAFLSITLLVVWNNSRSKHADLIMLGIFVLLIIYLYFRKRIHTYLKISTDVNLYGRERPKYCE